MIDADALLEAMSRAMAKDFLMHHWGEEDAQLVVDDDHWRVWRKEARVALAAAFAELDRFGVRMVPIRPTPKMLAGAGIGAADAARVWSSMLAGVPSLDLPPEPGDEGAKAARP